MIEQGSTLNNNSTVLSQSQLQNGTRPLDTAQVVSQFNGYRTAPIERVSQEDYRQSSAGDANRSQLSQSRYKNKYSFKRLKPETSSFYVQTERDVKEYRPVRPTIIELEREISRNATPNSNTNTIITTNINTQESELIFLRERVREQEQLLAQIREISYNRKLKCERESKVPDVQCINTLVDIYNLTIINTQITRLTYIEQLRFAPTNIIRPPSVTPFPNPPINITPISPPKPTVIPPRVQPEVRPFPRPQPQIIPMPRPEPIPFPRPQPELKPIIVPRPEPIPLPRPQPELKPIIVPRPQPEIIFPSRPDPQVIPPTVTPTDTLNIHPNQSDQYQKEIRELRFRIQKLESEKYELLERIKIFERKSVESTSYQETIFSYRQEIQRLKTQITQLNIKITSQVSQNNYSKYESEVFQLREQVKIYKARENEFEDQLEAAQQHIIYLEEASKNKPAPSPDFSSHEFKREITELKRIVSQYEEQIGIMEKQKISIEQKYILQINQLKVQIEELTIKIEQGSKNEVHQSQVAELREQIRRYVNIEKQLRHHLEEAEQHIIYLEGAAKNQPAPRPETIPESSGVDVNIYNSLLEEYGKYYFQSILLLSEIQRLKAKNADILMYLEKAEDYIMELQQQQGGAPVVDNQKIIQLEEALELEYKNQTALKQQLESEITKIMNINIELTQKNISYETQINQFQTTINNYETKITHYTTTINKYETTINNYETTIKKYETTIHNYESKPAQPVQAGIDKEAYEALALQNGKKTLQTIILMEEIYRLNLAYQQFREHLHKANEHIKKTQQYVSQLELSVKTESFKSSQTDTYTIKIKDLENKITLLNQEIARYRVRESEQTAELRKVDDKYKITIDQLNKNYTELQKKMESQSSNTKIETLQAEIRRLTIEITEITQHLTIAESYIQQNSQIWEKSKEAEESLEEKISIIELLKKDLEMARNQNKELHERTEQLEKLLQKMESRKKDVGSSQVSTQSKETEHKLENYIRMYKESQTKLHQAESQIISLQTEIKKISTSSTTKVTTITSSSSKADDFSIEREKWIKERQNLETEVNEIKNHLIGAETYIRQLEQQLETLNKQYIIIQTEHKSKLKENDDIHQALLQAEIHISQMEKKIPKPIHR